MKIYKILIVDDDPIILEDILTIIDWEKEGFNVITAVNGEQGLQKSIVSEPDIIMTDVRMPYMDGLSMIKEIKAAGLSSRFLMLSAYGEFSYVREAMQLGVCDYILKPELSSQNLLEKIRKMMEDEADAAKRVEKKTEVSYSPLINNAIAYICAHYNEPDLKNSQIADFVALSSGRLCVRFKEEVGQTLSDYITDVRVAQAKELLISGRYKVYEVASLVGYNNSTYFSSVFHDRTGISPAQYHGGDDL